MKHIQKMEEPAELLAWKASDKMYQNDNLKWKRLRPLHKQPVHAAICKEQGGICCYCGIGIDIETSHIEHFRPKEFFPVIQFEYDNLLCSCQKELQVEEPRHCGRAKGSWFVEGLTISPLDPDCETRFEYLENGKIKAVANDPGAIATIRHLDLDGTKLRELRKAAIDAAFEDLDLLQDDDILETKDIYHQRSPSTDCFQPFCLAIIQNLEELIDEM